MSTSVSKKDQLVFISSHIPPMHSGEYMIEAEQTVELQGKIVANTFQHRQQIAVAGNRLTLNPLDYHTVFPPEGSTGDHSNVLPHIVFKRSTLPWEWFAQKTIDPTTLTAEERVPWMCLLVLTENDKAGGILQKEEVEKFDKTISQMEGTQLKKVTKTLWQELLDKKWIEPYQGASQMVDAANAIVLSPSSRVHETIDPVFAEDLAAIEQVLDKARIARTATVKDITRASADKAIFWQGFKKESFENEEQTLSYLTFDIGLLNRLLPKPEELQQLAHVRQAYKNGIAGEEQALVMGNRLPAPGESCTVHLLSLEGRICENPRTKQPEYDFKDAPQLVQLISLKKWQFHCADHTKSFSKTLENIQEYDNGADSHTLRLPSPPKVNEYVDWYLKSSYVPLPHAMRMGSKVMSWFRGPLVSGTPDNSFLKANSTTGAVVKCADDLLRFDTHLNMLDTSYAAAWELGRMLLLSEKDLAQKLFQWKQQEQTRLYEAEALVISPDSPFRQQEVQQLAIPLEVEQWIEDIRLLKHIPFNYLVPDQGLIPKESLRFFQVDERWIETLLDGAFSIGQVSYHGKGNATVNHSAFTQISGVLLRSDVVKGWPDLLVDAYDTIPPASDEHLSDHRLNLLRMEWLTDGMLLCLFDGVAKAVDIHLKPEALHFGFNYPRNSTSDYTKTVRQSDGIETSESLPINWRKASDRVVDITQQKEALRAETTANFALKMTEGVPRVRYTLGEGTSTKSSTAQATDLHPSFKDNPTVKDMYTNVSIKPVPNAEQYEFQLTQQGNPNNILIESSKDHIFIFAGVDQGLQVVNDHYTVEVRVMLDQKWQAWQKVGLLTLDCPYIDQKGHLHPDFLAQLPAEKDTFWVYARTVPLCEQYGFEFTKKDDPTQIFTKETKGARFKLSSIKDPNFTAGKYSVRIKLMFQGNWGEYGEGQVISIE